MRNADMRFGRRQLLAGAATALAAPAILHAARAQPAAIDFQGERMVVNAFGGSFGAAWKQHVIEPFQKQFNAQLAVVDAITGEVTAKVLASRNNPQLDVVILGDSGAAVLAQQGLFEPLTEAAVPNLRELIDLARLPGDVYAEFLFASEVLVYNKNQVSTPPTSWNDLFDPKYKQHILIPDLGNSVSGPVFLVHQAILNGGSLANIDPGFEALKRLKPNTITYWTSMQQIGNMLSSGDAWLGIWSSDRAASLIQSGAPVALAHLKDKPMLFGNAIGTVKGTKHLKLAQAYVNFVLSAEVQGNVLSAAILAPTNKNAVLTDAAKPFVVDPRGAQVIDWAAVAKDMPTWLDRWNRTITQ
jgi:putative spermidine/putrescine transport system substrate-binding protein